ncbi:MAG: bifunctional 3,4-dihydroxy-2-butanone-4-phosphate synthase/GTP cyclohydrolase II [Dehalococcoidia bacterium]|nr:bifunctional 3,4-dihydroxy-2-butanone-4-phosphate synthase/GTP cyclohydrolase II [Dehalococcoidia bacterium]
MSIIDVEGAAARMRRGEFVIIVDDAERENEGDLAIAADMVTPEKINFMVTHARGLVCVPLLGERLDELNIPMMAQKNTSTLSTAFTESVDAKAGVTTGISAGDRSTTVRALVHPETRSGDLMRPGHMFPLRYREGGVLVRTGHTEAVIDLTRAAGLYPAGVICEIMNEDGTMARMPQLEELSAKWDIPIVTIAQIIEYRRVRETMVERKGVADLPTRHGVFRAYGYASSIDAKEHVAIVMGDINSDEPVLTRVHSECVTGDVFSSMRCDCGEQLDLALQHIAAEGAGVFLYMRQEGRGVGLHNKLRAYALQDTGLDTVEANVQIGFPPDLRDYGIGAQILVDLGVRKLKLMTNNPRKVVGLDAFGLELVERVPIEVEPNDHNRRYLQTKRDKMGHILTGTEFDPEDEAAVDTESQS